MLGLGLAVTVGKRILGGVIDALFSLLNGRATYYENASASKNIVKDIDDADVLDKATILLTPTATSDARVHSVKTYTGDELVTNGTFDTDSDWTKGTGWSIEDGKASCDGSTGNLIQSLGSANKTYKLTFSILDYVSGYLRPSYVGLNSSSIDFSGNGTYSTYINSLSDLRFVFYGNSFNGSIDNVSVTEADADFDFDRASSATRINSDGLVQDMQSITDPELVLNGDFEELGDDVVTNGTFDTDSDWSKGGGATISGGTGNIIGDGSSFTSLTQANVFTVGKSYKITVDVTINSGLGLKFQDGSTNENFGFATTSGSYTFYGTANNSSFVIGRRTGGTAFDSTIDNVSVQQVDPNDRWTVANSDADNYVEFTQGFARLKFLNTSPITSLNSTLTLEQDKTYELVVDVHDITSGKIKIDAAGLSELFDTEGVTTRYLKPTGNTTLSFYRATADVDITLASVSIKDITFSTDVDLARINYDSNGDNGHILLEPTSTNFVPYSEDFSQSDWVKQTNITPTYNTTETLSPDGTYNATKLVGNGTDGIYDSSLSITGDVTRSVYLKSVSGTINVKLKDSNVDIGTETLTVTTEWQRFYLSGDNGTSSQGIWIDDIPLSGVYIFGAQVENLPYATSYIPTYGSTVTRATETLTGSGNSTLINSTEGVLYAEIASLTSDVDSEARIVLASSGDTNNSLRLYYNTTQDTIEYKCRVSSSNVCDITYDLGNSTQFHKIACKWKQNDFALWVDGVEVGTDTSGSTFSADTLNVLNFSNATTLSDFFYGKCKALAVFNEALSDDELELLTGVTNYGSFGELASANGYTII